MFCGKANKHQLVELEEDVSHQLSSSGSFSSVPSQSAAAAPPPPQSSTKIALSTLRPVSGVETWDIGFNIQKCRTSASSYHISLFLIDVFLSMTTILEIHVMMHWRKMKMAESNPNPQKEP